MGAKEIEYMLSSLKILLMHVIKIVVEQKTTNSWIGSIYSSLKNIKKYNTLGKKAYQIKIDMWRSYLEEIYLDCLGMASVEMHEGVYEGRAELVEVNKDTILDLALIILSLQYGKQFSIEDILNKIDID